ncbi:hypothetical protein [Rhizobium leguminosarum]|uniref:hypothetical protein n=1 Tax=Rhizobium leguminosarum TaxID=384 RepID=UPI0013D9D0E5|nr:hypothetical protein [Rhizobium leguminosarum]
MPLVDEFVLRTLKLAERLPAKRLASFFGFTDAEIEPVTADLVSAGLIVIRDDYIELHPSAHAHFRGSEDGAPRVVDVDPWIERLWFDLVSRNMMAPDRARPTRNLLDIRPDGMARELPVSFARKAFQENFAEYLRKVRRISNPDRFSLYSVSDVEPERFGSVVIRGTEELVFDPQPRLRPHLLEVETENFARFRPLANALNDAYRALRGAEPSAAALSEFSRILSDTTVARAHNEFEFFDYTMWMAQNVSERTPGRQPIIGAPYIARNADLFVKLLEDLPNLSSDDGKAVEIRWFRPGGSIWGITPDLQETIASIKSAVRRKRGKAKFRTKLIIPPVSRRENPKRFDRIFDEGFVAPSGHLSPAMEVLLVSGIGAIVVVRVAFSATVSAPVGFAIVDKLGLERIEKALKWERTRQRSEELWANIERAEEMVSTSSPIELEEFGED